MIKEYLKEAIDLELNLSKLYLKFSNLNSEDYVFWYSLSIEEGGHASILKNILSTIHLVTHNFNVDKKDLDELKLTNKYINKLLGIKTFPREEMFKIAIFLESSAGEIHYQKLIESDIEDSIVKTFIELNKEDEMHLERIIDYTHTHNIDYEEE